MEFELIESRNCDSYFDLAVNLLEKYRAKLKEVKEINVNLKKENKTLKNEISTLKLQCQQSIKERASQGNLQSIKDRAGQRNLKKSKKKNKLQNNNYYFQNEEYNNIINMQPENSYDDEVGENYFAEFENGIEGEQKFSLIAENIGAKKRESSERIKKMTKLLNDEDDDFQVFQEEQLSDSDYELDDEGEKMLEEENMTRYQIDQDEIGLFVCPWPGCGKKNRIQKTAVQHYKLHLNPDSIRKRNQQLLDAKNGQHLSLKKQRIKSKNEEKQVLGLKEYKWSVRNKISEFEGKFQCCDCGQLEETKELAIKHLMKVHNFRKIKCPYDDCDHYARSKSHLTEHLRKHTGEKPFACDWPGCEHKSPTTRALKLHCTIHTGEKVLKCEWPGCEYRSNRKYKITIHMRGCHTNERPYKCTFEGCDKGFVNGPQLRKHINFHIKPFKCVWPGCDKAFSTNEILDAHMYKHENGQNKFICSFDNCTKSFVNKKVYQTHMKKHMNPEEFEERNKQKCEEQEENEEFKHFCFFSGCEFKSVSKVDLKKHQKKLKHSNSDDERSKSNITITNNTDSSQSNEHEYGQCLCRRPRGRPRKECTDMHEPGQIIRLEQVPRQGQLNRPAFGFVPRQLPSQANFIVYDGHPKVQVQRQQLDPIQIGHEHVQQQHPNFDFPRYI